LLIDFNIYLVTLFLTIAIWGPDPLSLQYSATATETIRYRKTMFISLNLMISTAIVPYYYNGRVSRFVWWFNNSKEMLQPKYSTIVLSYYCNGRVSRFIQWSLLLYYYLEKTSLFYITKWPKCLKFLPSTS
jgi:hypothetical protein